MTTRNPRPQPGDTVCYDTGGQRRTLTVTDVYDDIKNGRPGFDGTNAQGDWWGYDDQIVWIRPAR